MSKEKILNDIINGKTKYSNKQYNSPKIIGFISKIFFENSFSSIDDYKNYYNKNVLSDEEIFELSVEIYDRVGRNFPSISEEDIYNYLMSLIFLKSWDGFVRRENLVVSWLKSNNFSDIRKPKNSFDFDYAVDLVAKKKGWLYLVQVKPESIRQHYYESHLKRNMEKNLKFFSDYPKFRNKTLILYFYESGGNISYELYDESELSEMVYG